MEVKLTYKGGSVAWILVEGRGRYQVFPGSTDLYTLLSAILGNWDVPE